jgi:hypothetical protein
LKIGADPNILLLYNPTGQHQMYSFSGFAGEGADSATHDFQRDYDKSPRTRHSCPSRPWPRRCSSVASAQAVISLRSRRPRFGGASCLCSEKARRKRAIGRNTRGSHSRAPGTSCAKLGSCAQAAFCIAPGCLR